MEDGVVEHFCLNACPIAGVWIEFVGAPPYLVLLIKHPDAMALLVV